MEMIPQVRPWLGKEELKELKEVLESQWISGGPKIKKFQEEIAKVCGVKHAITVCNGTQALYVALKILGIGKGDEVIVPDFTFIATANAVVWAGAKPVFVDIDRTLNIDPRKIEAAITKKTRAILPVHLYGQSADMAAVMKIAKKHRLFVVEDAAQGIGVTFKGKPVGSFGDAGCLSFYADKTITTGEGGMVLTNSQDLAQKAITLQNQGRISRGWYIHEKVGYNFRMCDFQAAVGLGQLKKLGSIIKRKKRVESLYRKYLKDVPEVSFPYIDPRGFNIPFRMIILVNNPQSLMEFLEKNGVKAGRTFYPLHLQPCYKGKGYNTGGDFPNSMQAFERILRLPSAVTLTEKEIRYVCQKVKEFFK